MRIVRVKTGMGAPPEWPNNQRGFMTSTPDRRVSSRAVGRVRVMIPALKGVCQRRESLTGGGSGGRCCLFLLVVELRRAFGAGDSLAHDFASFAARNGDRLGLAATRNALLAWGVFTGAGFNGDADCFGTGFDDLFANFADIHIAWGSLPFSFAAAKAQTNLRFG